MMNAATLTRTLGGRWYGSYGLAFCPAHDNRRTPALSLADGEDGRLLATCHAGCSFPNIRRGPPRARTGRRVRLALAPIRAVPAASPGGREGRGRRNGRRRRTGSGRRRQLIAGTLAERISPRAQHHLPAAGDTPVPAECWHGATLAGCPRWWRWSRGDGFAVHRTYLGPDAREGNDRARQGDARPLCRRRSTALGGSRPARGGRGRRDGPLASLRAPARSCDGLGRALDLWHEGAQPARGSLGG